MSTSRLNCTLIDYFGVLPVPLAALETIGGRQKVKKIISVSFLRLVFSNFCHSGSPTKGVFRSFAMIY